MNFTAPSQSGEGEREGGSLRSRSLKEKGAGPSDPEEETRVRDKT